MTMPVLQGGEGRGGSWTAGWSHLLGHLAFSSWNRQGLINSWTQRINYNKSKTYSEHLHWHVVKRVVSYWDNPYYWPCQQAHVSTCNEKLSDSMKNIEACQIFFSNFIFSCCQIWLNCLMNDCHFGYITKFETKNPARVTSLVNYTALGFMVCSSKD